jgi:Uncharacterized protein conserved in bacteria (DUF2188)
VQQPIKIGSGEAPGKRDRGLLVRRVQPLTKQAAGDEGRRVGKANAPSQLVIHKADGTIETEHTYEYDSYPPPR